MPATAIGRQSRKGRTQMIQHATETAKSNLAAIKALTFLMFMMFAMTTDSVGIIIPEIIKQFGLSMTAAGAFQYATMGGIALAGFFLGYLADKLGRKATIVIGLTAVRRRVVPVCDRQLVRVLRGAAGGFRVWRSASSRRARSR